MEDLLTKQDVNVLIEAMEAYEKKNVTGDLMGDLFGMVLKKDTEPLSQDDMKKQMEANNREREERDRGIKEQSILLKGKLIRLRNSIDTDKFLSEV